MRMVKWLSAMVGCLITFGLTWWAWDNWRLPPSGSDRLSVALGVAAVMSASAAGPLFWWAGRETSLSSFWQSHKTGENDGWLEDVQRKMKSI
jgi:hypothetical protein